VIDERQANRLNTRIRGEVFRWLKLSAKTDDSCADKDRPKDVF
jgi:hypothetical protein